MRSVARPFTAAPLAAILPLALALLVTQAGCSSSPGNQFGDGGRGDTGVTPAFDTGLGRTDAKPPPPHTEGGVTGHDGGGEDGSSPPADGATGSDAGYDATFVPPTTCPATFTFPDNNYSTVVLQTDFDMWTMPITMTKSAAGVWSVVTPVPYGKDVEYKFVADGTWTINTNDPTVQLPSLTDGTNINNILQAVTCGGPAPGTLSLVGSAVTTSQTSYSFQVLYTPGAAPLDTTKTVVTLNGATVPTASVPYDAATHTFSVSVTSGITAPNKYGYVFQVTDKAGNVSRLFVPFWIEASTFEWNDSFMYEVMIDRFVASGTTSLEGPNGAPTEQTKGNWEGGDFGGVTQKITAGYFDQMGVNTLWISSVDLGTKLCEIGTGANTGYCLSGYHSYFPISGGWTYGSENDPTFIANGVTTPIDPHFGAAADLVTLVNTAHQHGIRVLTDLVVNHVFSDATPPMGQSPQQAPLAIAHDSDGAWFNSPYSSSINDCGNENLWDTSETSTWNRADCWFDPYLPDLNTTNPSVNDEIANHAVWLMEQFNLDGFRIDAVKQVTNNICTDMRAKITAAISTNLPFYMVGEALGGVEANVFDCVASDRLNGSMDDTLHNTIVGTVLQSDGSSEGPAQDLLNGVEADEGANWTGSVPGALMGHFFGSHDTPRAISLAAGDSNGNPWSGAPPASETNQAFFQHLQLAQAFLLTYDSIPIIWMGDEFGQPGTIDPDCRRMMRFGTALTDLETQTLGNLQVLGTTRAAHPALRRGPRTNLWVDNVFYADGRVYGTDITVVALNLSNSVQTRTMNVGNIGLTTGTVTDAISKTQITVAPAGLYTSTLTITLQPLTAAVYTN